MNKIHFLPLHLFHCTLRGGVKIVFKSLDESQLVPKLAWFYKFYRERPAIQKMFFQHFFLNDNFWISQLKYHHVLQYDSSQTGKNWAILSIFEQSSKRSGQPRSRVYHEFLKLSILKSFLHTECSILSSNFKRVLEGRRFKDVAFSFYLFLSVFP